MPTNVQRASWSWVPGLGGRQAGSCAWIVAKLHRYRYSDVLTVSRDSWNDETLDGGFSLKGKF
jgi:hypothetical protein